MATWCDNGPEYLSDAITQDRFNRTVRYEWLSQYYWDDLAHVQFATEWMWQCNHERPNMGIGGMTPKRRLMAAA